MLAVNSVLGAEPSSNDISSNTGTVGLATPQTRNLNTYFAGTATAEVRHEIDGNNVGLGRFHGKYTADSYLANFSGVTTLSGHSNSALLQGSFNAPFASNPGGLPWFYNGNPQTTIPASPSSGSPGPLYLQTGQILSSYRIWIRGSGPTSGAGAGGAELTSNYELRRAGADGLLGNADDSIIVINASTVSGNTATLSFAALPEDVYRLTVKDSISNVLGMQLDGELNGTAGGNWHKDFVVGANSTSLTSPNGFVFDPYLGVLGAGQLLQGANNSFDGLGRLQIDSTDFIGEGLLPTAEVDSSAYTTSSYNIEGSAASEGYRTVASSVVDVDFASTGQYQLDFSASVQASSGGANAQVRFLVNGVPSESSNRAWIRDGLVTFIAGGFKSLDLTRLLDLSPGRHVIQVQVWNSSASTTLAIRNPTLQVVGFQKIDDQPTADVEHFYLDSVLTVPTRSLSAADAFTTVASLTTVVDTAKTGDYLLSFNASATDGGQVRIRYVVDGVPGPTFSSGSGLVADALAAVRGQWTILELERRLQLSPGTHTIEVQVNNDASTLSIRNRELRLTGFNLVNGESPVTIQSVEQNSTIQNSFTFNVYETVSTLALNVSDNHTGDFLLTFGASALGGSHAFVRYVVDGVPSDASAAGLENKLVYTASTSGWAQLTLNEYLRLTPGNHTVQIQVKKDTSTAFEVRNSYAQLVGFKKIGNVIRHNEAILATVKSSKGDVSRTVTVPRVGPWDFSRTVDTFVNAESAVDVIEVKMLGNLGSDAATTVFATSDGDLLVEPTDLWFGTDDGDGTGTPAIIHLLHGPFGLQPTSVNVIEDNVEWTYDLTVPAGETKRLASFTVLGTTQAEAIAAANALVTNTGFGGQAAAFLTTEELASLANFEFNSAPTDIALSSNIVPENQPVGTSVGNLSTTDANVGDTFTYSLVTGSGDADNSLFSIVGNSIVTGAAFDFETKSNYLIRIRTTDGGGLTFEKAFTIDVTNVNEAPLLTGSQSNLAGNVLSTLTNTGTWSDPDADNVTLAASIGTIVKNANGTWDWSFTPTTQLVNQAVTVTANDGVNTSSVSFTINANVAVVLRGLAYNGATGTSASTSLATDKVPLLPGQSSTFANYTNYSRGLNAFVVDVAGLPASTTNSEMLASLQFAQWNGIAAAGFTSLAPTAIPTLSILSGLGTGGSTRVRVTFPDNTVQNTWLRITVLANAQTGLAANDVFYFGNVIGELDFGNTATRLRVNGQDAALILGNQSPGANSASVTNKFDLDRNGRVNGQDYAILLANQQAAGIVAPITAPNSRFGQRTLNSGESGASVGYWSIPTAVQNPAKEPTQSMRTLGIVEDAGVNRGDQKSNRILTDVAMASLVSDDESGSRKRDSKSKLSPDQVDMLFVSSQLELDAVCVD